MDTVLISISWLRKLVTGNSVYKYLLRNSYLRRKMLSFIYQGDFEGLRDWQETELGKITEVPLVEFIDNVKNSEKIRRNQVQILQVYFQFFQVFASNCTSGVRFARWSLIAPG